MALLQRRLQRRSLPEDHHPPLPFNHPLDVDPVWQTRSPSHRRHAPSLHLLRGNRGQAITKPASVSGLEPRPKPGEPAPPPTILATTLPTLGDPDNWRPAAVFPLDLTHVRNTFRTLFSHPHNCVQNSLNSPSNYRSWTYKDTDIQLNSSWISNRNWRLLQVTLSPYRCDGPPDADFVDHWFAISPNGHIRHIGRLMHFAGAADFAHQGRSELLFSNLADNQGGYKLWYDNFSHHAQALVTFH